MALASTNGAGKSTILDAITWALFGKSRARSDDDVVNRLASANGEAAEVKFLFELEGLAYRIIRRKTARKPMSLEYRNITPHALRNFY
jgi:exonuclease SbcC